MLKIMYVTFEPGKLRFGHHPSAAAWPTLPRSSVRGTSVRRASSRSEDAIGADVVERSIYDVAHLPTFKGWAPCLQGCHATAMSAGSSTDPSTTTLSNHPHPDLQCDIGHPGSSRPLVFLSFADVVCRPAAINSDPSTTTGSNHPSYTDLQCSITHPGSLSCTESSVHHDDGQGLVLLTLKTSVRRSEGCASATMRELEELGWMALRQMAAQREAAMKPGPLAPGLHKDRHQQVLHLLQNGVVVDATKKENSFGHVNYVVTLEDPKTKQRCQAFFKPRVEGDCEGWHRVPIEVAAYHLNLLLGMDYVPPAVYRGECDADWKHFEAGGALIYWCPQSQELKTVPVQQWGCSQEVLLSDTRILDVLIQNSDRHAGHFLWGEHWAKGSYQQAAGPHRGHMWRGIKQPALIDQAAGFRSAARVELEQQNAFCTGPVRKVSARSYLRLRFLDWPSAAAALGEYLSEGEIRQMLGRRDAILNYFDKLVAQRGYSQVVLEDSSPVG